MDIVRKTPKNKNRHWIKVASVLTGTLLLGIVIWQSTTGIGKVSVSRESLLVDEVKQGDLLISVRGVGVLAPKDERWVAANVNGRVEQIHAKAGAQVRKGDLLMVLNNPLLEQELEETRWQLEELEAQINAEKVTLESQLLDQETRVTNERLNYERALLTLNAQQKLLEQGVVAVSQIRHEEIKIDVEQFNERWQLEIKRLAKNKESIQAQQQASQARLNRMRRILQRVQDQVENLHVKASMDSIVQEMPLELGQQVNLGSNLARLARSGEFIAELRIPEKQVSEVAIGQIVTVDTKMSKVKGVVQRIEPTVVNGSVQVDVALTEPAPKESRPDLTVDGTIEIAQLTNTLYVKRPMFAKKHTSGEVFLMNQTMDSANKQLVAFGQQSTHFIEIKQGLTAGQSIIISDVAAWESQEQIQVN
ncbi:HlyD family secretion protein [Thalassotalea fusca]